MGLKQFLGIGFLLVVVLYVYDRRPRMLVVDNGSPLTAAVIDHLVSRDIPYKRVSSNTPVSRVLPGNYLGLIMTGGPLLYSSKSIDIEQVSLNLALMAQLKCPILGICFGHQTIVEQFGGKMGRMSQAVRGLQEISLEEESPLFQGLSDRVMMYQGHNDHALEVPYGFECIASSATCPVEAIQHKHKHIYGVQFHPESSGAAGARLLDNFVDICRQVP